MVTAETGVQESGNQLPSIMISPARKTLFRPPDSVPAPDYSLSLDLLLVCLRMLGSLKGASLIWASSVGILLF
ncbi:hypothetical protein NQZ68_008777 [Dissostichus eleginoides]|nr:hypothetical protein NQZ68_008777 [Dissostichus eleginoides]